MRSFVIFVVFVALSFVAAVPIDDSNTALESETHDAFLGWLKFHNKNYEGDEFTKRLSIFAGNMEVVNRHNSDKTASYKLSNEGPFADLTFDEFKASHLMEPQDCSATNTERVPDINPERVSQLWGTRSLPLSVDWRTKGVVTPIKNQGQCGSCWTFSTTASLEAHTCIKQERDCSEWSGLSEQQLVDCAQQFNNHGCNGGLPSQAFEYVRYAGGLDSEEAYPYTHVDGKCTFERSEVAATTMGSFNITQFEEDDIVKAVAGTGPVSIAFQVAGDFHLYANGVYDSTVCNNTSADVNHAVVVVGYGTTDPDAKSGAKPADFYIIRNSWGTLWGMEGYFWMVRDKNMCGIADCASYPLV